MNPQRLFLTMRMGMLAAATLTLAAAAIAQQSSSAYQGVSKPPADAIEATPEPPPIVIAKPSAAVVATQPQSDTQDPQPTSAGPVAPPAPVEPTPTLATRATIADPDGDIVQPRAARPGELLEGATIRVKLTERLSSSSSEKGEAFHGQVAYDVLQDGKVLIPAGSGIEGQVTSASAGHFGGHGSLHLKPEAVILPDGSRFMLHAETTGTPGSKTRVGAEGSINPGSRVKKDSIEYGAVVGTGAITGAVVAGPVGALTGGLIGAGLVTTHIMVDHPQATLEPGSMLMFTLTEPMNLMATN